MFQFAYRGTQGVAKIKMLPIAGSQTLYKGDPVNVESGLIAVGAAADSAFAGIVNQDCSGLAEGTLVEVILADDETVFRADYVGSSKTSLANADIGTAFDLGATTNYNKINLDDTTDGAWVCVGFDNVHDQALVKCLASKRSGITG